MLETKKSSDNSYILQHPHLYSWYVC